MKISDQQPDSFLILIVGDDRFMRLQLRRAMEQTGYQVVEASDGEQGLAAYSQLHPDIVLLDALMPVMDGFTCCSQLQTLAGSEHTPVLMITALDDQESVDRAFAAGATDYITKPIHWTALHQRVRCLLQASQATAELQRQNLRSQLLADVTLKIRQSLQLHEILQTAATEMQKLLQADRVLIYRLLKPNGFGKVVTEAVVPGWPSVIGQGITDDCFGSEYLQNYYQGRIYTISDVENSGVLPCLVEFLKQFGVKAKLVIPILLKEELWGLLIVHQCSSPRQWSSSEIQLLQQLTDQISIALTQAQLLEEEICGRQELARSNVELQQFTSVASHDLQEPLRKIQALGNRLKEKCAEALTEQGIDYLDRMQNAARRMQVLIDDLLMLSRITTLAQPFMPVDLSQVTQEVLSDLEVRVQQTHGCVEVGKLPIVEADPLQMRQLLQNLIGNALKFRQEEPHIVRIYSQLVEGQQQQPLCQIFVEDNGIGFDEKYLDRIFNVFQRLHARSEYEGTGMGLAICRKIAERHGGSITAKSTMGQGATFIVTLPIKQSEKSLVESSEVCTQEPVLKTGLPSQATDVGNPPDDLSPSRTLPKTKGDSE